MNSNPVRSILAVLAGFVVLSFVAQVMELALAGTVSGGDVAGYEEYFAVMNRPAMQAARLGAYVVAAVLGGYVAARVAGLAEMPHALAAAALQVLTLLGGMTGEYGAFTPRWLWAALIVGTVPAMLLGAAVRARARRAGTA